MSVALRIQYLKARYHVMNGHERFHLSFLQRAWHVYYDHIHCESMEKIFEQFSGFQWDRGNIDKNFVKHNRENWECEQVFFNRPLLVLDDPKHSVYENRCAAFGKTDGDRFFVVIFTKRDNLIRVISARDMNRKERKFYDEKG